MSGDILVYPGLKYLGMKLVKNEILSPESRNLMWTRQESKARLTKYGFGWSIGTDSTTKQKVVAHSGSWTGAASYWRIYPDSGVVVVVLSNRRNHKPGSLGATLGNMAVLEKAQISAPVDDDTSQPEQEDDN